ncbi:MAG: carbamoyl-phosphate synthase large subunit, partial [Planctomycetota bacterium]
GGPNRIGQGIEFDYCCVHACMALREEGFETIMVNCNPETVSTDYDTADRLYFEPLTLEDVLAIHDREKPEGVIVQFGGQTPLNLAIPLEKAGVRILGTSPASIHRAEDREAFNALIEKLGLKQPRSGIARTPEEAVKIADRLGLPVLVRPSYVLGGRAMEIVYDRASLVPFVEAAAEAAPGHPILIDRFLDDAIELDVDCVADGERAVIGGVMEHIEMAGIHSGDSACALPPYSLPPDIVDEVKAQTLAMAKELDVRGLMNVQFAVQGRKIYVLEVNPRASRTVPFVSKAIGVPLAKIAAKVMAGRTLESLKFTSEVVPTHVAVKECVLPFNKMPGCDILLGPEMKSTGEVMGLDHDFGFAFAKSQMAASQALPLEGSVVVTVNRRERKAVLPAAKRLKALGFSLLATAGTQSFLAAHGIEAERIFKIQEGSPNILDLIQGGNVALVINTPTVRGPRTDEARIRRAAIQKGVPCITTVAAANAAVEGITSMRGLSFRVYALQDLYGPATKPAP